MSTHRPELDGLRTIAIVPVVCFHAIALANVVSGETKSPLLSGGFLGVDVFFVLSGYLITRLLLRAHDDGSWSARAFFLRRARRLIPALTLVVGACLLWGSQTMTPEQLAALARSAVATMTATSNLYFWQTIDYFSAPAMETPLLHTWSLAVEEQFYLLYPPVLLGLVRRVAPEARTRWLLTLFVVAAVAAVTVGAFHPDAAFYAAPTRAFELLAGAVVAALPRWPSRVAASLAFAVIVASFVVVDADDVSARLPLVLMTALFIATVDGRGVGWLLSAKPVRAVGLRAYSIYLVHQPILAFVALAHAGEPFPVIVDTMASLRLAVMLTFASVVVGSVLCALVERPARRGAPVGGLVAVVAVVIAAAVALWDGAPHRYSFSPTLLASFSSTPPGCVYREGVLTRPDWQCPITTSSTGRMDFFAAGDSHLNALLPGLQAWAQATGRNGAAVGAPACPHIVASTSDADEKPGCRALNERIADDIAGRDIKNLLLIGYWPARLRHDPPETAFERAQVTRLEETIARYAVAGVVVHVVIGVPVQPRPAQALYRAAMLASDDPIEQARVLRERSASRAEHEARLAPTRHLLDRLKRAYPDAIDVVDVTDAFCDARVCPVGTIEVSYFADTNHLSMAGALRAAPALSAMKLR